MKHRLLAIPPSYALFVVVILLTGLAWYNRAVFDDAFISYRYAQHMVQGHGLVFNIGEAPVEGYTNFLWTLLMGLSFILSLDPIFFSWIVSLTCFVGTLIFTYVLARDLIGNAYWGVITVALLGTNYTFNVFATSGLETQCQAMLITAALYTTYRLRILTQLSLPHLLTISLILSALLLLRLDSALFVGVLGLVLLYEIIKSSRRIHDVTRPLLVLGLPITVIIGIWLLWKISFYDDILPNTFYAKVSGKPFVFVRGLFYLVGFWLSYWLFPFPFLIAWTILSRKISFFYKLMTVLLVIWTLYLFYVGGDHMEFRFMVPVLPLLMILIVTTLSKLRKQQTVVIILGALVILGSVSHYLTYNLSPFSTHQNTVQNMRDQHDKPGVDWDAIGKVLGRAFNYDPTVTIALNPAGIIPYYSRARTVDMLGLNDRWVAQNGVPYLTVAAHETVAPFNYLLEQEVNLHIEQPVMFRKSEQHRYSIDDMEKFHMDIPLDLLPDEAVFLVVSINDTHELLTIYLKPHPTIEAAIEKYGWQTYSIIPS